MKKVIVFDIDRTIVDSYSSELLSFQEAYFNVTGNKLSEDDINNFTTLPTSQFFDSLNLNNNTIDLINKEWSECFNSFNTVCFPNIKNIIRKLKKDGYIIGIITSRTLDEFHELDDELNEIMDCFTIIVTSDIIDKPKPNVDSMNYLINKIGCSVDDVIYIGDSLIDKTFSKNCKVKFIPACFDNMELKVEENACFKPEDILKYI